MKKVVFALAGLAVIGLGAHVVAGPMMAMSDMKAAVESNDGEALAERIDFPALRADLKQDMDQALEAETDPMSRGFASAIMSGMIEGLMTPDAMIGMMSGGGIGFPGSNAAPKGNAKTADLPDYSMGFGLSRFTLTLEGDAGPIDVIFAPHGLTWKVVGVDMDLNSIIKG